ncbi:Bacterial extracellular solute-binding protein [Thiorhodovibrio winogradskyi]|uniref:Bacterial extracellular solute-binding protein n=1 Tax=Thiorhodovibrio winogradskyi TaxID=77007 RepID=A0ABZ0SAD3_9GAMM
MLGLGLLALLAWPGSTLAAQPETYSIGVEDIDYLPVSAYRDGAWVGVLPELLDAFAADEGLRFEYRPLPVSRLLRSFLNGEIDFKLPDHPDWQNDKRKDLEIHYSHPLLAFTDGTLVRPERMGEDQAAIRTLATVIGFTPWAWQEPINQGRVRLRESLDLTSLLRQTLAGRVDAAYASIEVATWQLEHDLDQAGALVFDPGLPHARDHYHLSTLKHPTVLRALDRWLERSSDKVAAIKADWGIEADDPNGTDPRDNAD